MNLFLQKRRFMLVSLALVFFGNTCITQPGNPKESEKPLHQDSWPTPRVGLESIAVDGYLFAIGGFVSRSSVGLVERFDLRNRKWKRVSDMPTPRSFATVVESNGRIYVLGGLNDDEMALGTVESYDIKQDQWKREPSIPTPRNRLSAIVIDEKIYVTGGMILDSSHRDGLQNTAIVEVYDVKTKVWTKGTSLSLARHGHRTVAMENTLYVIGGFTEKGVSGNVEKYLLETKTWVPCSPMPTPRGYFGATVFADQIVVVGGRTSKQTQGEVTEVYHPTNDIWTQRKPIPNWRDRFGDAVWNEKLYLVGGEIDYGGGVAKDIGVYHLAKEQWTRF